jgi:hypothetical protein
MITKKTWDTTEFKVFEVKGNSQAGFKMTYKGSKYWEVKVAQYYLFSKPKEVKKIIMGFKQAKDWAKSVLESWNV